MMSVGHVLLLLLLLLAGASGCREAPEEDSCCSVEPPAAGTPVRHPGTSLYLLDSKFTDQGGRPRHLHDFRGQVVVTSMIFTNCEYACPRILADLRSIESALTGDERDQVHFLLVSMDVERDRPEVLAAHAEKHGLDTRSWTLLHGDDAAVRSFAATLGVRYKKDAQGSFAHSNLITVLHRDGRIAHQLEGLGADLTPSLEALRSCLSPS